MLITAHHEKYKTIVTSIIGNVLFAVTVYLILNFKKLAVYFFWKVLGTDCLINNGFEVPGDPYENIEYFRNVKVWESFTNPTPNSENQLEFITYHFWDSFVFSIYPAIVFLFLLNTHYIFAKIASLNLKEAENAEPSEHQY